MSEPPTMIADIEDESTSGMPTRARRFPVDGVVQYRAGEAADWREATLVNVSQSGVLFSAAEILTPGAVLELILELASPLRASATVVRSVSAGSDWQVGAKFDALSFVARELAGGPEMEI